MLKHDALKIAMEVSLECKFSILRILKLFPNRKDGRKLATQTLVMLLFKILQVDLKSNGLEGKTGKAGVLIGERLILVFKVKGVKSKSTGSNSVDFSYLEVEIRKWNEVNSCL